MSYDELISMENLFCSWRTYKIGKSKKSDVMEFERHLEDNLFKLSQKLKKEEYRHDKYSYFRITDPKKRDIYKSTVRDRIVHQALYEYLCKIYEPLFIKQSFSSRKEKGAHKAIEALVEIAKKFKKNRKKCLAMKCDIRKYFENINHKILLEILCNEIQDKKIFNLLKMITESFHHETGKGIPLGNITSQIFANIYLNELDVFVLRKLKSEDYVRYNDDFIIFGNNSEKLVEDVKKIKVFLKEKLLLELPREKIIFRKLNWGIDFCGFVILPNGVLLRNKTKSRMLENIKKTLKGLNSERISLSEMQKIINSYLGLLAHCNSYNLETKIKNRYLY